MLGDAADDPDTYFEEGFLVFLKEVFCKAISATTNLELGFAAMRHWLCSAWRPPHIWSLACYHVANRLKSIHAKWMEATFGKTPKFHGESRSRPIWAQSDRKQTRGGVVNSHNMFVQQRLRELQGSEPMVEGETKNARHRRLFVQASRDYNLVSDRSASRFDAAVENAARNSFDDPLKIFIEEVLSDQPLVYPDSSPWGIADKYFPVGAAFWAQAHADAHMVRANKSHRMESFVDESFHKWAQATGEVLEGNGVVPEKLSMHVPCLERCTKCLDNVCSAKRAYIVERLECVVAPKCAETIGKQLMLRLFIDAEDGDDDVCDITA